MVAGGVGDKGHTAAARASCEPATISVPLASSLQAVQGLGYMEVAGKGWGTGMRGAAKLVGWGAGPGRGSSASSKAKSRT